MISIDGSAGEGGGQILRTALALAIITQTPFEIDRIRARRQNPGLRRQHLAAVHAAQRVCDGQVRGAALGSTTLEFRPGPVRAGEYHVDTGTAGSTSLVFQTVLPPLLLAAEPSVLTLCGGTHNPHAPPFEFLRHTFAPLIERMGPRVSLTLERHGFYPAGGGELQAVIEPAPLRPIDIVARGAVRRVSARALVANLPAHIAERELRAVHDSLCVPLDVGTVETCAAQGPGNALLIRVESEHADEVFAAFGERGVPAERIARQAADEANRYLASAAAVGGHLADQLLLPFALAGSGSFTTLPLSGHARTNIDVIQRFLAAQVELTPLRADDSTGARAGAVCVRIR
ncbi:MAG: RNA 3'-terminal phosphate cyclase [Phycisphaerae bacterium]